MSGPETGVVLLIGYQRWNFTPLELRGQRYTLHRNVFYSVQSYILTGVTPYVIFPFVVVQLQKVV